MNQEIIEFIENTVGNKIENQEMDLLDQGILDSLEAISLIVSLEKKFTIKFSFADYSKPGFFSLTNIVETINKGKKQ